jgi:hypothetical protein
MNWSVQKSCLDLRLYIGGEEFQTFLLKRFLEPIINQEIIEILFLAFWILVFTRWERNPIPVLARE